MLDFQKCTAQDLKAAAAIERKRRIEEERKPRIFNPRIRRIGIDKEYLDRQVEEKKRLQDLQREQECRLDEALLRSSQLAIVQEKRLDEERRKLNKELNTFRQTHQKPEFRRDFDLYDPELLKKSKPPGEDGVDPGLASAQKFEGEDENLVARLREQREQMQSWIMQQVQERRLAEREKRDTEQAYQEALLSRDRRALALEHMELECRRRLSEATARFNRALAEEKAERKRCRALQDNEAARAEIYNHVTGDFLTEPKDQAESVHGPKKLLVTRYKGMTSEQLKVIRDEQARQMEEIQRMRAEENEKNEEWNRLMNGNARAAESYQRELDRRRAELNRQIAEENLRLAEQQRSQQDYLNRHVYKNKPGPEFYAQFNKSTR
ncbi:RIB43A-like with coiled-coils protein 2 [Nasonia vitripennis]|uniref:RIB43A-like with coiled-coils protein 2 n=1 Tax=Nasonia vitripennis TaxID=7425 RepID=A0A7M7G8G2_NASVI|nr:RIB43A-like with coiled-coils protein 2 [Nasonia vitripennis]